MNARNRRTRTLDEQLGNVGAELVRAANLEKRGKGEHRDYALARALALLDTTLADTRWKKRYKEPARLRELVAAWFAGSGDYDVDSRRLIAYCTQFAVRARIA